MMSLSLSPSLYSKLCSRTTVHWWKRTSSSSQEGNRRYTVALARAIPYSFANALSMNKEGSTQQPAVSVDRARRQHDAYLQVLRKQVPTLCLPALPSHPDCVFVEDTVVAVGNHAVINRLGASTRRGEVDDVQETLLQFGMNVTDMREERANGGGDEAICDGGDVMFTGRHLFVGLSHRTNHAGARLLQQTFGNGVDVMVVPPLTTGNHSVLHLKSAVTHVDEETLLAPEGRIGDEILKNMRAPELGYQSIRLPNLLACNVVAVNGCIMAQDVNCSESRRRLEQVAEQRGLELEFVDTSELAIKDGALTCCSILLDL